MKRILVIEDDQDVAEIFAELIDILGHEAIVASDVDEGLSLAASCSPHLVLCDLGLPGNGLEFARACKRDDALRHLRIMAISGRNSPEDKEAALAAGFSGLLAKPVDFETLQAVCADA